jgi:hypothetical protein
VQKQLQKVMFRSEVPQERRRKSIKIVKELTDFRNNGSHNRHLHYEECHDIGLNVRSIEADFDPEFQDIVLTIHHCYMHTLMNTPAFKIIENHNGATFAKMQLMVPVQAHQQGLVGVN